MEDIYFFYILIEKNWCSCLVHGPFICLSWALLVNGIEAYLRNLSRQIQSFPNYNMEHSHPKELVFDTSIYY